jgi:hypothetical protein
MKSKSIKGKSPEEVRSALHQSMTDGFAPSLAIVFSSIRQDHTALTGVFDEAGIAVFGCSTNGEFVSEDTMAGAIAILLLDINKNHFMLLHDDFSDTQYREKAASMARIGQEKFPHPAFLLVCSDTSTDAEALLLGFEDVTGQEVTVFGAAAGDDLTFSEQIVFTNGWKSKRGTVVLVLDEDFIKIRGRAICGWHAVGTERTVTKSEGNHVFTVDDVPVLDLTAKYGGIQNVSPDNKELILEIASTIPLQLQRERGDPVMRPGLHIDWSDRSFYCSGSVPQGSKIKFSLPPDFDVVDKVVEGTLQLKATEMPEADALVVFSCGGRIVSFGPMINTEIEGIKNVWNVPMAGMFSNAELGRTNGGNLEMHNLTTCVVALKEK